MTTRFDTKDPDEDVTMLFDFTSIGVPTSPEIEVEVFSGEDATPSAILLGSPSVVESRVYQRAQLGLDGVDYTLRCFAQIGTDRVLIDAILPVRRRPGPAPV